MTYELPDNATLYQAMINRDESYDGRAWVGVSSTGIFCRLNCPAPNPKFENCSFYGNAGDCIAAGFRPCKRCHPLGPVARLDPVVERLLAEFDARPNHRWSERDITDLGLNTSTVRRAFLRHFNMTFLDMARQRRLRHSAETLAKGDKVITAQLDAGFESPSAFRTAFSKMLGLAPGRFADNAPLRVDWLTTPVGHMLVAASADSLHLLEFPERPNLAHEIQRLYQYAQGQMGFGRFAIMDDLQAQMDGYFAGARDTFDIDITLHGTPFTQSVWQALRAIPAGQTRSYAQVAGAIGKPSATRAVARANGSNQIAIVIPCHRVIGADGKLTGYAGGLWRKQKLIEVEAAYRD